MGSGKKALLLLAFVVIAVGAYGMYHASALGSKTVVDGTIVELKTHTGLRPICLRRRLVVRKRCFTKDGTEQYTYYTEVVEYKAAGGDFTRTEDQRQRGGEHDAVGDHVKVILTAGSTAVEIAPKSSMAFSQGVLLVGVGLLSFVLVSHWIGGTAHKTSVRRPVLTPAQHFLSRPMMLRPA